MLLPRGLEYLWLHTLKGGLNLITLNYFYKPEAGLAYASLLKLSPPKLPYTDLFLPSLMANLSSNLGVLAPNVLVYP